MNTVKAFLRSAQLRFGVVLAVVLGAVVAAPSLAGAVSPDPTAETTTLITGGTAAIAPIMVAIATGVLVITVLWFGLTKVLRAIRSGGRVR